ncbi:aldo/keto reductase [Patescibacteria group bacterium]|nr:aldo/keto reductase [Patescibacteria group bacterium]
MKYRYLGKSGLQVSELCLGTMTFGRETDETTAQTMINLFLEAGGNFVDTADVYGKTPGLSEEIVGRALKGRRNKVILATKVFFPTGPQLNDRGLSRTHIMQAVQASLHRLQTDYIDLYYVHCWDGKTALEETLLTLNNLVESGKVRYLGVSNFTAWQLMKALKISELRGWSKFICLQPQYSLVVRDIEREILPLCREEGLGVAAWGPLGGGFLSGKYHRGEKPPEGTRIAQAEENWEEAWSRRAIEKNFRILDVVEKIASSRDKSYAQVALAWIIAQPGNTLPIIGARTLEQLKDNLGSVGWELTLEQLEVLDEVSRLKKGYPYQFIRQAGR